VRRFAVEARNRTAFDVCNGRLLAVDRSHLVPGVSPVSEDDEDIFVHHLIRSPTLLTYLKEHGSRFDGVILLPYLYGPVIDGVPLVAERALLQPCLHDEAYAYLPSVAASIFKATRLLFLSEGERELATKLYGPSIISKSIVAGAGVEIAPVDDKDGSLLKRLNGEKYVLCLGRKDPGKKTDFIARCFEAFRHKYSDTRLQLVIAGPGQIELPMNCPGLVEFGVVTDAQKHSLLENCRALFHPSDNESYSRVIMEAWLCGRPAAASAYCLATASAISQGGGWIAANEREWESLFATIDHADDAELAAIGKKGQIYACQNASWKSAIGRYEEAIDGLRNSEESAPLGDAARNPTAIHQILPNIAFGDAISNHAIWIKSALRKAGYRSEIFALGIDPKAGGEARLFEDGCVETTDAIIYHHSIGSAVTPAVLAHPGPKSLIYHNITPHQFLEPYLPLHARLCREGRNDLPTLASSFTVSVGDSSFNAEELSDAGFQNPGVLPICIDPAIWAILPDPLVMKRLLDGRTNILFVGRLSPNKKQEDLIFAFSKLRALDPSARLILVGTPVVTDDLYLACLRQLCTELDMADSVEFTGHVTESQLVAYYRTAHLFWSMSEHEGFCVPLIEAMWYDVPVLAYASSAVPETMATSGALFTTKDDATALAARALQLTRDPESRRAIITSQKQRRCAFIPSAVEKSLSRLVLRMLSHNALPTSINNAQRFDEIREIAVVKLDHIGDLLLASPVFTSLKRRFPDAEITAVVSPQSADILLNHPDVARCITYDAPWFWRSVPSPDRIAVKLSPNFASLKRLLSKHFDLVVNLRSDLANILFSASLPHTNLLSYTNDSPYSFLATQTITRTRGMHISDQHRALLAEVGATYWAAPRLYPTERDYDAVRAVIHIQPRTTAIFLGAGIALKRWSPSKFQELIGRIRKRGIPVAIVGSEDDKELASVVANGSEAINLCGKFNLLELSVFLEGCTALVTNDSAPMHIAAAVGTPVIYITRPNTVEEFSPVGEGNVKCCAASCAHPCEGIDANRRNELVDYCSCIQGITVDEVETKLWDVICNSEPFTLEPRSGGSTLNEEKTAAFSVLSVNSTIVSI
jgi:ADP-heptose:LPS heptosyltransferase/glycosyltransferase involved in cell wall biosynthesis